MITTAKASRTQPLSVSFDMEKGAGGPPIDPGYIRVHVRVDVGSNWRRAAMLGRVVDIHVQILNRRKGICQYYYLENKTALSGSSLLTFDPGGVER